MRIKTSNKLQQEVTALDLAVKMLRAENEGMRRSVVTLKLAIDAPLALWESHWLEGLPKHEQELIRRTAKLYRSVGSIQQRIKILKAGK